MVAAFLEDVDGLVELCIAQRSLAMPYMTDCCYDIRGILSAQHCCSTSVLGQ